MTSPRVHEVSRAGRRFISLHEHEGDVSTPPAEPMRLVPAPAPDVPAPAPAPVPLAA